MLALGQRVSRARVDIDGRTVVSIGRGLLAFVCAGPAERRRWPTSWRTGCVFADEAGAA